LKVTTSRRGANPVSSTGRRNWSQKSESFEDKNWFSI